MSKIIIRSAVLINPVFHKALAELQASRIPVPVLKHLRRIAKKIGEEFKDLQEDTKQIMKDVFKDILPEDQLEKILKVKKENHSDLYKEFKMSAEKQEAFAALYKEFDSKCIELGNTTSEIPFPKVVLPENFEFRTDYATILEDVLDLD